MHGIVVGHAKIVEAAMHSSDGTATTATLDSPAFDAYLVQLDEEVFARQVEAFSATKSYAGPFVRVIVLRADRVEAL